MNLPEQLKDIPVTLRSVEPYDTTAMNKMTTTIDEHGRTKQTYTNDWITPDYLVKALGEFDLDPCSSKNPPTPLAKHWYYPEINGLEQEFFGRVWLNPPFLAKEIRKWLELMRDHRSGIALIPSEMDRKHMHELVLPVADSIFFMKGRIKFRYETGEYAKDGYTKGICLIAYTPEDTEWLEKLEREQKPIRGTLVKLQNCVNGG